MLPSRTPCLSCRRTVRRAPRVQTTLASNTEPRGRISKRHRKPAVEEPTETREAEPAERGGKLWPGIYSRGKNSRRIVVSTGRDPATRKPTMIRNREGTKRDT